MKKSYKISGMHCGSCAINIGNTLKKAKGIKKASVDFQKKKLSVEGKFDDLVKLRKGGAKKTSETE